MLIHIRREFANLAGLRDRTKIGQCVGLTPGKMEVVQSNSVKYQAAVTLPPITTMLVKGRLDPSLKIQATIEEPPLIEPPIRVIDQSESAKREEDLDSFLEEEFHEETADPVDYSIEYSSESYDESYEYAGSGDYSSSSSSSSSSLTDDESLHGADERNRVHIS